MPLLLPYQDALTALRESITTPAGHKASADDPAVVLVTPPSTNSDPFTILVSFDRSGVVALNDLAAGTARNLYSLILSASVQDATQDKLWGVFQQAAGALDERGYILIRGDYHVGKFGGDEDHGIAAEFSKVR